jgi:type II secretory pathway component PulC
MIMRVFRITPVLIITILILGPDFGLCEEFPPFSYYRIIEERNFFRPKDRENGDSGEGKESKASEKKPKDASNEFIVTGIVNIKNTFKAIIEKRDSGESYYVRSGDSVNGYKVKDINTTEVTLEKGGADYSLILTASPKTSGDFETENAPTVDTQKSGDNSSKETNGAGLPIMQKLRTGQGGVQ